MDILIMNIGETQAFYLLKATRDQLMNMFNSNNKQVRYAVEQFFYGCATQHYSIVGDTDFVGPFYDYFLNRLATGDTKDVEYTAKFIEMISCAQILKETKDPVIKHHSYLTVKN